MEFQNNLQALGWPLAILLAWFSGEYIARRLHLSRISVYAVVGFVLAPTQLGWLSADDTNVVLLLANIAFGLILFECGHRINLRWLLINRWLTVSSLAESLLTFAAVWQLGLWLGMSSLSALLLGALSMATSPAAVLRVINEEHSSGQVTERALHLAALNCVLAVFTFKIIVGLLLFRTSGSLWQATYNSFWVLTVSSALGAAMGGLLPIWLKACVHPHQDHTTAFAIGVICLVALTHSLKLSPVLATLVLGLTTRHRRLVLSPSERGFGVMGELMSVLLFVFIASTLDWSRVNDGLPAGIFLVMVRAVTKLIGVTLFSRLSGTSWRKGALAAMAIMPISAFVILVLEQSRYVGVQLVDQLAPLAAVALLLEILGPLLTEFALHLARETPARRRD